MSKDPFDWLLIIEWLVILGISIEYLYQRKAKEIMFGFKKRKKQETPKDTRYYGGNGTIHKTGEVNVVLDKHGNVVAVWFRCQLLPFTQSTASDERVSMMANTYTNYPMPSIEAIVLKD